MTDKLIPLPAFHEQWIRDLFEVSVKITMSDQEYKIYWQLVDGFWSHQQTQTPVHGKSKTKYYMCRITKSRTSSTADRNPSENASGKSRVTVFQSPGTCQMKIKVTETLIGPKTFTVQQVLNKTDTRCREHDHSINASWKMKRCSFLTGIISDELAKGYTPAQVKDRLKGTGRAAGYERLESIGGAFMKRKDCANIGQQYRTSITDVRKFPVSSSVSEDWEKAIVFLLEKGYFCETIRIGTTKGMVFAHPTRLNTLTRRGYLTVFDSTHKFNIHEYNLFTFMCRNEFGIWVPGAHCLVERENSDILALAIRQIFDWSQQKWKMQYPLTDNSAIEKAAVVKAFAHLEINHVKNHLLCTVHSERTLSRNFKSEEDKETYGYMRHALRVLTEEECVSLITKAINATPSLKKKRYIERDWLSTRSSWAMFARQHSSLLIQATSSNACEAWHGRLKNGSGQKKGDTSLHGFYGCVRVVHDCAHDVGGNVLAAELNSRTQHSSLSKRYSPLQHFPFAVQKIIATEESKVNIRLEQNMPPPTREMLNGLYVCHCLFSRRYKLPCQHIFHIDRIYSDQAVPTILTPEAWLLYQERFGPGGMEMFEENIDSERREEPSIVRPNDGKAVRVLRLAEVNERIRSTFYTLDDENSQASTTFIEGIENLINSILSNSRVDSLPQRVPTSLVGRTLKRTRDSEDGYYPSRELHQPWGEVLGPVVFPNQEYYQQSELEVSAGFGVTSTSLPVPAQTGRPWESGSGQPELERAIGPLAVVFPSNQEFYQQSEVSAGFGVATSLPVPTPYGRPWESRSGRPWESGSGQPELEEVE